MTCAHGKPRDASLGVVPRRGPLVTFRRVDAGGRGLEAMTRTRQGTRGIYLFATSLPLGDRAILALLSR